MYCLCQMPGWSLAWLTGLTPWSGVWVVGRAPHCLVGVGRVGFVLLCDVLSCDVLYVFKFMHTLLTVRCSCNVVTHACVTHTMLLFQKLYLDSLFLERPDLGLRLKISRLAINLQCNTSTATIKKK